MLREDWMALTSRPWIQGPIDYILGNGQHFELLRQDHAHLMRGLVVVGKIDAAIGQEQIRQLIHVLTAISNDTGVYVVLDAIERIMDHELIFKLERLSESLFTKDRIATFVDVAYVISVDPDLDRFTPITEMLASKSSALWHLDTAEEVITDERLDRVEIFVTTVGEFATEARILRFIQSVESSLPTQFWARFISRVLDLLTASRLRSAAWIFRRCFTRDRLVGWFNTISAVLTHERLSRLPVALSDIEPLFTEQSITWWGEAAGRMVSSGRLEALVDSLSVHISEQKVNAQIIATGLFWTPVRLSATLDNLYMLLQHGRLHTLVEASRASFGALSVAKALELVDYLTVPAHMQSVMCLLDMASSPRNVAVLANAYDHLATSSRIARIAEMLDDISDGKGLASSALARTFVRGFATVASRHVVTSAGKARRFMSGLLNMLGSISSLNLVNQVLDDVLAPPSLQRALSLLQNLPRLWYAFHTNMALTPDLT